MYKRLKKCYNNKTNEKEERNRAKARWRLRTARVKNMEEMPEYIAGIKTRVRKFDLSSYFNMRCKDKFYDNGFRCCGRVYYRLTGDVFQSFRLHRAGDGARCMIEFAVLPLCEGGVIKKTSSGNDRVKAFGDVHSWFEHDETRESIVRCADLMIAFISTYLMPFFEEANTAEKAYKAVSRFQEEHRENGIDAADPHLCFMAIKSKMYDAALKHLNARKAFIASGKTDDTNVLTDESEIALMIERLEKKDYAYFEELVRENEKIARDNFAWKKRKV